MNCLLLTKGPIAPFLLLCLSTTLVACLGAPSRSFVSSTIAPISSSVPLAATPSKPLASTTCVPTIDDGVSPSYKPDAPVRSTVGEGHILTGVVLSGIDCSPIQHAKLELWPEYEGLGHPDEARATIFTDVDGRYRFESDQPEHIHMRISAPGFVTIGQNSYHPGDTVQGTFDIVLMPLP